MEYCLSLAQIKPGTTNTDQVGHKAYNLASLSQAGFRVPQAFCVTTNAYVNHLAINQLEKPIQRALNNGDLSNAQKTNQIQEIICLAPLPDKLDQAISQAYFELTKGQANNLSLAVRSSGTAEDTPSHSFAGQYATFLGVSGKSALVEKIKACWASIWSKRAISYRAKAKMDHPKMAVIVQRLIPADVAGVAFTANPITGKDEIVVEAVAGLGEGLVSGTAKPDTYQLDRYKNTAISTSKNQHILGKNQLEDLRSLALDIEDHFRHPQDIEWAFANNRFFVLQSRPITALQKTQSQPENITPTLEDLFQRAEETGCHIWTKDNVGEVIPGVVTSLSWSVIEPLGNNAFRSFLRRVGIPYSPETSLFARFEGQVYFNLSQLHRTLRFFYLSDRLQSDQRIGAARKLVRFLNSAFRLVGTGLRTLLLFVLLPIEARKLFGVIPVEIEKYTLTDAHTLQAQQSNIEHWRNLDQQVMSTHVPVTVMAMLLYSLFEKLLHRWIGTETGITNLMAGLPGMKSAEPGRELFKIAQIISQDSPLRDRILNTEPTELAQWFSSLDPQSEFVLQINSFLKTHGHASLREFELAFPSWREDVSFVLIAIQNMLQTQKNKPEHRGIHQLRDQRLKATQAVRSQLGFGLRRLIFEGLLRLTQDYSVIRENIKYTFVMTHSHLRREYLSLAALLHAQQKINEPDDIFYFTSSELDRLINNTAVISIRERKIEHKNAKSNQFLAPNIIVENSDGTLEYIEAGKIPEDSAATLKGVPASAGRVRGKARVILDPLDAIRLKKDEILVTPSTNPAWSPLFLQASGLITEIGGTLSHGAILAREYNLPAVLNVENATRIIKNGQSVLIDGTAGTVTLLEEITPNA